MDRIVIFHNDLGGAAFGLFENVADILAGGRLVKGAGREDRGFGRQEYTYLSCSSAASWRGRRSATR
jgi:hypothetical protein